MSVISRRSKRKTKKALAKHGVKGAAKLAPVALKGAPVALAAGATAQHAKKRASDHASYLADEVKARSSQAADHWNQHAAPALSKAASDASTSASAARAWAVPRIAEAGEMSKAQLTQAYGRSVEAAAPRVEHAAQALAPKVDHARDRIVEDFLPRLLDSVSAAAAAASDKVADATTAAASASQSALSSAQGNAQDAKSTGKKAERAGKGKAVALRGKVEVQQRRPGIKTFLLVSAVIGAATAAGFAVWKSKSPSDPWVPATGGDQTRLSHPGQGSGLGSGGIASSTGDVTNPAPDGKTAPPDESGKTVASSPRPSTADEKPSSPDAASGGGQTNPASTTGSSAASVVPPRSNPPKAAGSTSPQQSRATDPEAARARDVQSAGEASEVTETVVRPAPQKKESDPSYAKPSTSPTQGDSGRRAGTAGTKPGDAKPAGATSSADEATGISAKDKKTGTADN